MSVCGVEHWSVVDAAMRLVAAVDVLILLWGLPWEQLLCVLLVMVSPSFQLR